jgi:hypothetical protein
MLLWESWTFGFLHASGFYVALVMVIWIVDYHSYAEGCYDGVVTSVYVFLYCDVPPLLLLSIYCLPSLILVALLGACVPLGPLGLVVLCIDMFVLLRVLLLVFLV